MWEVFSKILGAYFDPLNLFEIIVEPVIKCRSA